MCVSDEIYFCHCITLPLFNSDEEEGEGLEIFIEAPEGFRNSDEDYHSQSEVIIASLPLELILMQFCDLRSCVTMRVYVHVYLYIMICQDVLCL